MLLRFDYLRTLLFVVGGPRHQPGIIAHFDYNAKKFLMQIISQNYTITKPLALLAMPQYRLYDGSML